MSFHSVASRDEDDSSVSKGLTHDVEVVTEILKKRNQQPRKSWFGHEKERQEIERKLSNFHVGSEGEIKDDHKMILEEK